MTITRGENKTLTTSILNFINTMTKISNGEAKQVEVLDGLKSVSDRFDGDLCIHKKRGAVMIAQVAIRVDDKNGYLIVYSPECKDEPRNIRMDIFMSSSQIPIPTDLNSLMNDDYDYFLLDTVGIFPNEKQLDAIEKANFRRFCKRFGLKTSRK